MCFLCSQLSSAYCGLFCFLWFFGVVYKVIIFLKIMVTVSLSI